MSRPIAAAASLGVLVAVVAGGGALAATHAVAAIDYEFQPASLTVAVGDTVRWSFSGEPHTVTSGTTPNGVGMPDGRFDSGLRTGGTYELVFTAAGTFPYFCKVHAEQMTGSITVRAAATPPPTPRPTAAPTRRPTPPPPTPPPTARPTLAPTARPPEAPTATATATATPTPTSTATPSARPSPTEAAVAGPAASGASPDLPAEPSVAVTPPADPSAAATGSPVVLAAIVVAIAAVVAGALVVRRRA